MSAAAVRLAAACVLLVPTMSFLSSNSPTLDFISVTDDTGRKFPVPLGSLAEPYDLSVGTPYRFWVTNMRYMHSKRFVFNLRPPPFGTDRSYSVFLRATLPLAFFHNSYQTVDVMESCRAQAHLLFQVNASSGAEYDTPVTPKVYALQSGYCTAIFHFWTSGPYRFVRDFLPAPTSQLPFHLGPLDSTMDVTLVANCPPESAPRRIDTTPGAVNSPSTVFPGGKYPVGLQCHYVIDYTRAGDCWIAVEQNARIVHHCDVWFKGLPSEMWHWGGRGLALDSQVDRMESMVVREDNGYLVVQFGMDWLEPSVSGEVRQCGSKIDLLIYCIHTEPEAERRMDGHGHEYVCDEECTAPPVSNRSSRAQPLCWGPLATQCVACRHVRDQGTCIAQCGHAKYSDGGGQCRDCHPRCVSRSCVAPREQDCDRVCEVGKVRTDKNMTTHTSSTEGIVYIRCADQCPDDRPFAKLHPRSTGMQCHENATLADVEARYDLFCAESCPRGWTQTRRQGYILCEEDCNRQAHAYDHSFELVLFLILFGSAVALIMTAIVIVIVIVRNKMRKARKMRLKRIHDYYLNVNPQYKGEVHAGHLRDIDIDELEMVRELGRGAFGTVREAIWRPKGDIDVEIRVAVKQLHSRGTSDEELLTEAASMASVDCEHLLRLVAVCMTEPMLMVTAFMPHGGALDFIRHHQETMNAYQFIDWSRQLANGMAHLEAHGMLHRDLAARNVLIESPRHIRISDFGLSKFLDVENSETHITGDERLDMTRLPVRWLAKECLLSRTFSHKSDVWAYGVTLWELYTYGKKPYASHSLEEVRRMVIKGRILPQPPTCSIELFTQLIKCWMSQPDNRPSFVELETWFETILPNSNKYFFTEKRERPVVSARNSKTTGGSSSPPTEHGDTTRSRTHGPEHNPGSGGGGGKGSSSHSGTSDSGAVMGQPAAADDYEYLSPLAPHARDQFNSNYDLTDSRDSGGGGGLRIPATGDTLV